MEIILEIHIFLTNIEKIYDESSLLQWISDVLNRTKPIFNHSSKEGVVAAAAAATTTDDGDNVEPMDDVNVYVGVAKPIFSNNSKIPKDEL